MSGLIYGRKSLKASAGLLAALCLLAVLSASFASDTAVASPSATYQPPPIRFDLALESRPESPGSILPSWSLTIRNVGIDGHQVAVRDIKVRISPLQDESCGELSCDVVEDLSLGRFDAETGIWSIPELPSGGSAEAIFSRDRFQVSGGESYQLLVRRSGQPTTLTVTPLHLQAEIIDAEPSDRPEVKYNNVVEQWYLSYDDRGRNQTLHAFGDAGVSAETRSLGGDDIPSATIVTVTPFVEAIRDLVDVRPGEFSSAQFDVRIRIELDGLELAGEIQPATGNFDPETLIWDLGRATAPWPALDVPVRKDDAPSLARVPPERRCLTARVVSAVPPFELDQRKLRNDVAEACLAEPKAILPDGEIVLWWIHDCVGVTASPCGDDDELLLLAHERQADDIVLPDHAGEDRFFAPQSLIFQVHDPAGRQYDGDNDSLTDGTTVSWQTGRKDSGALNHEGVRVWYSRADLSPNIDAWSGIVLTASVSGATPGRVKVRFDNSTAGTFFDPNPSHQRSFGLSRATTRHTDMFFEFEKLGTYVVNFQAMVTRADSKVYTVAGDYTFHVGPIAELAVRDGGPSSLAPPEHWGYTIQAVNNGPDAVSSPRITLTNVPQGAEVILDERWPGEYLETRCVGGLCDAVWTLSQPLPITYGPDPPTLTLVTDADDAGQIRASIANNGPYTVTIDGETHTGTYLDHITENSSGVSIRARPGAARSLVVRTFHDFDPSLLIWEEVDRLHDWEVDRYEVHWFTPPGETCQRPAFDAVPTATTHHPMYLDVTPRAGDVKCYTVRAVNLVGHKTHWYTVASIGEEAPGTPRSLSVLTYADPPIAVVTWGPVESVNGWPISKYELWTARGEETCRKPRLDQAGEEVTGRVHLDYSINPNELTCYYVRAVNTQKVPGYWSEPALTAAGISDLTQLTVQGGAGVVEGGDAQFTISASPAPVAGDTLQVQYTVSQRGNFVSGGDLGQDSVIIDSRGRADITVPTEADDTGEADGAVVLTLLSGSGYALSSARSASVAVADDDDPTVSFAEPAAGVVKENAGPHNVVIQVEPAPHEDFPIGYTTEGDAVAGAGVNGDYTISGSGTVMARAGQTSVVIPVQPTDNGTSEPDESLILWLSQGDGYALGSLQVYWLTIADDDGPRAEFARAESGVDEDGGTYDVVINLDPSPAGNVSINYQMGGPATRDVDYSIAGVTGPTASVSASAGATSVTIPVNITDDSLTEGDERLELTLLSSSDYNLGAQQTHALTIRDNDLPRVSFTAGTSNPVEGDGPLNVTVRLDQPAPSDFTLHYGVGGDATRNRDYRVDSTALVPGEATSVAIPVTIIDDGDHEPDETVVLTLRAGSRYAVGDPSEHTLTIADDDLPLVAFAAAAASVSERAGTHRATILLDKAPHEETTVKYTVGGTADEGVDFSISGLTSGTGTVTVPARPSRVQVPIDIVNDGDAEGEERVVLTLMGGDGYALALPHRYELTILDDDAPVATFTAASGEVAEGDSGSNSPHNVEVKLDRPAPDGGTLLTFSVSSPSNIGATSSDDYGVPATMTARVDPGEMITDIPVTIVGDGDNEADEIVVLTLEPGRGYSVGSADEYTLTIVDDDHDENTPVASLNNPNFHGTGATQLEWWEDGGAARPTWHVTENFTGDVIFQYVGGTATLHEDFTVERIQGQTIEKAGDVFTVRSLESPQDFDRDTGVRWARFIFAPIRDDRSEGRETAIFRVLNGPGYTVGEPTELTIIIKD
ncbi:MAG: hypothetical protein OXL37_12885 [Chloroflexota bacterium]|nr:hypothetical protein [Chloroflexota bacterium]MDE2937313.1 hypothetical protein [Chloroflexota bacterium]